MHHYVTTSLNWNPKLVGGISEQQVHHKIGGKRSYSSIDKEPYLAIS
jgi:hypothetical protein